MTESSTPTTRIEVTRLIPAPADQIFALLCDPVGHLAIDSSGMLQDVTGEPVGAVGDSFTVHMDREALNDYPELGTYDVTVQIRDYEQDRHLSWSVLGRIRPQIGHYYGYRLEPVGSGKATRVTSYYDWSEAHPDWQGIFPVLSEGALRATLGILDRTVRRGYR